MPAPTQTSPTQTSPVQTFPVQSPQEARAHDTFTALMNAFSRPGRIREFSSAKPFEGVAEALLDLETPFFTPDKALEGFCHTLGARLAPPEKADYLLFPALENGQLKLLEHASIGTLLYPDQSATLVLGATFAGDLKLKLSGPGVQFEEHITLGEVPRAFWTLRHQKGSFPLGWDVILLEAGSSGSRAMGIPRSSKVEVL